MAQPPWTLLSRNLLANEDLLENIKCYSTRAFFPFFFFFFHAQINSNQFEENPKLT